MNPTTNPGPTAEGAALRIGLAANHGGVELKQSLEGRLREAARERGQIFLLARFSGAERQRRRLAKVTELERASAKEVS